MSSDVLAKSPAAIPDFVAGNGRAEFEAWSSRSGMGVRGNARTLICAHRQLVEIDELLACTVEVGLELDAWLGTQTRQGQSGVVWSEDAREFQSLVENGGHALDSAELEGASAFFSRRCGLIHLGPVPSGSSTNRVFAALAHELVHQRLWIDGVEVVQGAGAWIGEGLATHFESVPMAARAVDGLANERLEQARALSKADMLIPLDRFCASTRADLLSRKPVQVLYPFRGAVSNRWVSLLHVESSALMSFLALHWKDRIHEFVRSAVVAGATTEAVEKLTGRSISQIQNEFTTWLEGEGLRESAGLR